MSNLLSTVNDGGGIFTAQHFADLECKARSRVHELNHEQNVDWVFTFAATVGMISSACLSPAAPVIAAIGIVGSLGSVLYGHGQFLGSKGIERSRAESLIKAMDDATEGQWEALCVAADDVELFGRALESGLLELTRGDIKHGDIYRKAASFVHAAKPGTIEGYKGRTPTALIPPAPEKKKLIPAVYDDEITRICEVCDARIRQSADREWAAKVIDDAAALLAAKNRQAATNKLIYNSKLTEKEFAKEGITKDRLKLIKVWAAEGAKPETIVPVSPRVSPVAVEPIAPTPQPETSPIAVGPVAESIVAPPIVVEDEAIEDEQDDDEIEDEEDEPIVQAAKPVFRQRANTRTPIATCIWDTTDLDTIEAGDVGNVNQFPIILVVAGQGNGKTVTLAWLFEQLSGRKAMFTPKADDHRNPAIKNVFDLMFGFNIDRNRGAWFGNQSSFDNSSFQDLDWYLTAKRKHGSALDFLHATCQTAENRTATGKKKGRDSWRVFYDEAAQTYTAGFTNTIDDSGISLGQRGEKECQWFITGKLKPAIFNFRGAGVQLFIGCQSETVDNIGLKGCAEARDEAWHLYPGPKAIEVARKHKQSKLVAFLQRAIEDGYAISILEKEGQQFKVIRMPKLVELERFDPIDEDEAEEVTEEISDASTIDDGSLDESWNDEESEEMVEPAIASSVPSETLDQMAVRIMAMTRLSITTRLQMIEDAQRG